MNEPMNAEAVAQMVADREAGTPGPWYYDAEDDKIKALADDYAICWDATSSDARRIARLPDLEAAYLALASEAAADTRVVKVEQLRDWINYTSEHGGAAKCLREIRAVIGEKSHD